MSWIEGWTIGKELLLAWLVFSVPIAVLVGLLIKCGAGEGSSNRADVGRWR